MGFTFSLKMVGTKILVPRSWYQDLGTKILVPRSLGEPVWYAGETPPEGRGPSEIVLVRTNAEKGRGSLTGYCANESSEIVLVRTNAENRSPTTHSGPPQDPVSENVLVGTNAEGAPPGGRGSPENQILLFYGETHTPPLGQDFRTAWLITGQKFP